MEKLKKHLKSTLEGRGDILLLEQKYIHHYIIMPTVEKELFIHDISVRLYERYHSMNKEDFTRYLKEIGIYVSYDQITDIFKIL